MYLFILSVSKKNKWGILGEKGAVWVLLLYCIACFLSVNCFQYVLFLEMLIGIEFKLFRKKSSWVILRFPH